MLIEIVCLGLQGTGWSAPLGGTGKAPASGSSSTNSQDYVLVELEWEGEGDLDLEVWSEDSLTYLFSAYDYDSPDYTSGRQGAEFIVMNYKHSRR